MKLDSHRRLLRILRVGGISRHGVIASARWVRHGVARTGTSLRIAWVIPASALIGLGVALILSADLGVPPYDVLLSAIDQRSVLTHGQASWLVSAVLMAVAWALGVRPRVVSLLYVFTVGLAIDLSRQVVTDPAALELRFAMAAFGLALLAGGVAVIVHTQATGGAMELLMQAGEQRGRNPASVRTALEVGIFGVGLVFGGAFGPMTVMTSLVLGPSIVVGLRALDDHRLGRDIRKAGTCASMGSPIN